MKKLLIQIALVLWVSSCVVKGQVGFPGSPLYVDTFLKQDPRHFIPADFPEVVLWVDAQATETVVASTEVDTWLDRSGNDNHLNQVDLTAKPEYTGDINGYPAVDFGNVGTPATDPDFMDTAGALWGVAEPVANLVIFIVFKSDAGNERGTIFHMGIGPTFPDRLLAHSPWLGGNVIFDAGASSSPYRLVSMPSSIVAGESYILTLENSVANSRQLIALNGEIKISDADAFAVPGGAPFSLCGYNLAGNHQDATVGEVIVWKGPITVAQREEFEGYLAWKWGMSDKLPLAHPYKSAGPEGRYGPQGGGAPEILYTTSPTFDPSGIGGFYEGGSFNGFPFYQSDSGYYIWKDQPGPTEYWALSDSVPGTFSGSVGLLNVSSGPDKPAVSGAYVPGFGGGGGGLQAVGQTFCFYVATACNNLNGGWLDSGLTHNALPIYYQDQVPPSAGTWKGAWWNAVAGTWYLSNLSGAVPTINDLAPGLIWATGPNTPLDPTGSWICTADFSPLPATSDCP